jgi:hypothetical protein
MYMVFFLSHYGLAYHGAIDTATMTVEDAFRTVKRTMDATNPVDAVDKALKEALYTYYHYSEPHPGVT